MAKTSKKKTLYVCQSCGAESPRWFGRCTACGEWNTCVEEVVAPQKTTRRISADREGSPAPTPITKVTALEGERPCTGIGELDRALGGGIVPGSVVLIGGDPGIGKSTLVLQACSRLGFEGAKVLYISGEESLQQIRLRAGRVGALTDGLMVLAETNLDVIASHIERIGPALVVVDSIQTTYRPELESAPGSVSQVRECAAQLMYIAKRTGIAVFLVGHVTKEGTIAGPRVLEHIVDTVLYLEGDRFQSYRLLRSVK
ncbi:MAG: AAA family ATPase, partial [Candidatus Latescibacteria bacterium]|nr:AAA family ATPase [Candidatus Latescibacterota bacterium]